MQLNNNALSTPLRKFWEMSESLYNDVRDYVKAHQGPKGYIDTQNEDLPIILGFIYDASEMCGREIRIHAVRVNQKTDKLQVLFDFDTNGLHKTIVFDEKKIFAMETFWRDVINDEEVYFLDVITNIATHICDYVEKVTPEKKRYRVAIHWEVAFVENVEAESEEEAYEIVKQMAQEAPSSDFQWLSETETEITENKS